ncbi:hypothetical protein P8625_06915 [Tenacibaculum tangerinum]|uniref:Uncharacterized protein n=1 Tax=Tenacibaculum tangerinum TaxID=3038772 RepID=A0ABY8L659_9FLAO|nr:hypothetical protein [Tenacibaculum tangerinum]WGH76867.1 hypothetical protein P8625_06915 [Tenacibaculum tangerinum]
MKKSILNLGRTLNKIDQKQINGGSYRTQEECLAAGCFWGLDAYTNKWRCVCPLF